jgi:hypothetical protein
MTEPQTASREFITVDIGLYIDAERARMHSTLRSLAASGYQRAQIMLLPDGPDSAICPVQHVSGDATLGPPACFNRLAAATDADVVVLLESGALPAPGAVQQLVEAVMVDGVGIAGPSTNSAWSLQGVFPGRTGHGHDVARTGIEAVRRYGDRTQTLAPLYGLADFCFAVRREVIDAIGGADEGYGIGPCWEMEYAARAARAGFDVRWVCGAYVYRAPFTARRRVEEARRFEASRHRYQDSLCALRLRGESPGYEPHCRGADCEHFAPRELMTMHRALPAAAPGSEAQPAGAAAQLAPAVPASPDAPATTAPATAVIAPSRPPTVSVSSTAAHHADAQPRRLRAAGDQPLPAPGLSPPRAARRR